MNEVDPSRTARSLRFAQSPITASHGRRLTIAILLSPIVVLAPFMTALLSSTDVGMAELAAKTASNMIEKPADVAFLVTIILASVGVILVRTLSCLVVTPAGLQGRIPRFFGVGWTNQTVGEWQLSWDDIHAVELVQPTRKMKNPAQQLFFYRLVLHTHRGIIRLSPFAWVDPCADDHRLHLSELLPFRRPDPDERIQDAPLLRLLSAQGFQIDTSDSGGQETAATLLDGYDLTRHRGMVAQMVLLFGCGAYALIDTVVGSYRPLQPVPVMPFVLTALATLALVNVLGRGAPVRDRLGVGALTMAALVASTYPALLRFNAMTSEPMKVRYQAVAAGEFEPLDRALPDIDLSDQPVPEYWQRYPSGTEHGFVLMRGDPGFYQLDMGPVRERINEFYEQRQTNH